MDIYRNQVIIIVSKDIFSNNYRKRYFQKVVTFDYSFDYV